MENKIRKATNDRTLLIEGIIKIIEQKLGSAQDDLFKRLISDLVDNLDRDGDTIKNTLRNKRLIAFVDNVFTDWAKGKGLEVAAGVINGVTKIMDFNGKYFAAFTEPAKLAPIHEQVKESLNDWLGISKTGKVEPNGYLDTLIQDPNIKNQVKDLTVKSVIAQGGYYETKKNLQDYITGDDTGSLGALKKYYRNFVYDTFSQIDRTNGKIYADKLNLNYAIYEGGLIETSRKFCKERNGKVFTRAEIAAFGPPEAKPPGYNPFFDLGGYGCRHHLNWVPDAVAFALRPDLKNQVPPTPAEIKQAQNPPPEPQPKKEPPADQRNIQAPRTPFDEIKPIEIKTFRAPTEKIQRDVDALERHAVTASKINKEKSDLLTEYNQKGKVYQKQFNKLDKKGQEDLLLELQGAYEKYLKKANEATAHDKEIKPLKEKIKIAFHEILLKDKPKNKFSVEIKSDVLKKYGPFVEQIPEAVEFFRVASRGWLPDDFTMPIAYAKSGRAHYSRTAINLTKGNKTKTIVHELGHHLESHNQVFKAAVDFLRKRTAGQPLLKLKKLNAAYRNDEVYKDGGFPAPYDGKIYTGNKYDGLNYTEIVSRGLEYMYDDPATFYSKDKEYFNFIYSMFF